MPETSPTTAAELPAGWPALVRNQVTSWRDEVLAAAAADGGRLLDLAEPGAADLVDRLGRGGDDDRAGTYDTVLSVAGLIHHPDLVLAVRGVRRLLAPTGAFRFVEPVEVPGWRGLALSSLTSRSRAARGLHLSRDVPGAVRSCGLLITELERRRIDTNAWPLRRWAVGRALIHDPRSGGRP